MDGSKVVHSASIYRPEETPPHLPKDRSNRLAYNRTEDGWVLFSGEERLGRYATEDIRMSVVYRAKCFADAGEAERYARGEWEPFTLEGILDALRADMEEGRGITPESDPLALALQIIDTYIRYPVSPTALVPFNYCVAKELRWVGPLLRPFLEVVGGCKFY